MTSVTSGCGRPALCCTSALTHAELLTSLCLATCNQPSSLDSHQPVHFHKALLLLGPSIDLFSALKSLSLQCFLRKLQVKAILTEEYVCYRCTVLTNCYPHGRRPAHSPGRCSAPRTHTHGAAQAEGPLEHGSCCSQPRPGTAIAYQRAVSTGIRAKRSDPRTILSTSLATRGAWKSTKANHRPRSHG